MTQGNMVFGYELVPGDTVVFTNDHTPGQFVNIFTLIACQDRVVIEKSEWSVWSWLTGHVIQVQFMTDHKYHRFT